MAITVTRQPITQAMQLALWARWGYTHCSECHVQCYQGGDDFRAFHWDHHLALVDGGDHKIENLRPLCVECHRAKSAREHKSNAKAKRIAAAREALERGEKKASRMVSRGFSKHLTRKFNGRIVPRNPATAET